MVVETEGVAVAGVSAAAMATPMQLGMAMVEQPPAQPHIILCVAGQLDIGTM